MKRSRGTLVVFLDDDAIAERDWLEELLAQFVDPCMAIAGSTIVPTWAGPPPRWFPAEFGWVLGCSYRGEVRGEGPKPVRNVIANGMAVRGSGVGDLAFRTDLGRVAGIPLGCEETELTRG